MKLVVSENEFPLDASRYSCIVTPSPTSHYRDDTAEALAASLHWEYSTNSSSVKQVAARCRRVIGAYLDHVAGPVTGNGRRALHVGCATGRLTLELAALFDEASHHDSSSVAAATAAYSWLIGLYLGVVV